MIDETFAICSLRKYFEKFEHYKDWKEHKRKQFFLLITEEGVYDFEALWNMAFLKFQIGVNSCICGLISNLFFWGTHRWFQVGYGTGAIISGSIISAPNG